MHKKILLAILVGLLIPLPQTVVPAWTAQVVNESAVPQAGVSVSEVSRQYSLESSSHREERITDAKGMVSFPRRSLWRPAIFNLIGIARNRMKDGSEALYGPVAYLLAEHGGAQSFTDNCGTCKMVLHPIARVTR